MSSKIQSIEERLLEILFGTISKKGYLRLTEMSLKALQDM
jgi:hypothetical protein